MTNKTFLKITAVMLAISAHFIHHNTLSGNNQIFAMESSEKSLDVNEFVDKIPSDFSKQPDFFKNTDFQKIHLKDHGGMSPNTIKAIEDEIFDGIPINVDDILIKDEIFDKRMFDNNEINTEKNKINAEKNNKTNIEENYKKELTNNQKLQLEFLKKHLANKPEEKASSNFKLTDIYRLNTNDYDDFSKSYHDFGDALTNIEKYDKANLYYEIDARSINYSRVNEILYEVMENLTNIFNSKEFKPGKDNVKTKEFENILKNILLHNPKLDEDVNLFGSNFQKIVSETINKEHKNYDKCIKELNSVLYIKNKFDLIADSFKYIKREFEEKYNNFNKEKQAKEQNDYNNMIQKLDEIIKFLETDVTQRSAIAKVYVDVISNHLNLLREKIDDVKLNTKINDKTSTNNDKNDKTNNLDFDISELKKDQQYLEETKKPLELKIEKLREKLKKSKNYESNLSEYDRLIFDKIYLDIKTQRNLYSTQEKEKEKEISKIENQIKSKQEELEKFKLEDNNEKDIYNLQKELQQQQINLLNVKLNKTIEEKNIIELNKNIYMLESEKNIKEHEINSKKHEIEELSSDLTDPKDQSKEINDLEEEINNLNLKEVNKKIDELKNAITKIENEKIKPQDNKKTTIENTISKIEDNIIDLQNKIKNKNNDNDSYGFNDNNDSDSEDKNSDNNNDNDSENYDDLY